MKDNSILPKDITPLKVCFPFDNKTIGGSTHATKLLIQQLNQKNIIPSVVVHHKRSWVDGLDDLSGDEFTEMDIRLPFTRQGIAVTIYDFMKASFFLANFLIKEKIDIVHTNQDSTGIAWSVACKLTRKAHVWHQHAKPAMSRTTRLLRNQSSLLLSVSEYVGTELQNAGRAPDLKFENLFAFEEAIDVSAQLKQKKRGDLGLENDAIFLMFVGSLTKQKRPQQALEVLAQVKQKERRPVKLKIFGDNRHNLEKSLNEYASQLGISKDVEFMGVQNNLADYYQVADFLLAPAINEGFGRVLVEAMYYGCIVIASDSGGHRDIVENGKSGFLVEPESTQDMATTLLTCLSVPNQNSDIIAYAKKIATNYCSAREQLQQLVARYDEISKKNTRFG